MRVRCWTLFARHISRSILGDKSARSVALLFSSGPASRTKATRSGEPLEAIGRERQLFRGTRRLALLRVKVVARSAGRLEIAVCLKRLIEVPRLGRRRDLLGCRAILLR